MAAPVGIVAWSLTAVLLSGLLSGCAQAPQEAGVPAGREDAASIALASSPYSGGHAASGDADDGQGQGDGQGPAGDARLGTIDVRLTRETWDRPAPYPARFAAYAEFRDARGREVDAPKDAAWTLLFAGDGKVRSAAGRSLPAFAEFEAAEPGTYVATFTLQADGFRTARQAVSVEAYGPRASDLVYFDGMAGAAPMTFTGAAIVYVPGQDLRYVGGGSGSWSAEEYFGHTGTTSWRSNYDDATVSNMTLPRLWLPAGGAVLDFWSRGGAEANGFDGLYINAIDPLGNIVELARFQGDGTNWRNHRVVVPGGVQELQFQFRADALCGGTPMPVNAESVGACGSGYDQEGFWVDDIQVWAR